jgi:predicted hotdog family 3-hydroxylacyl-ACP dehydratase
VLLLPHAVAKLRDEAAAALAELLPAAAQLAAAREALAAQMEGAAQDVTQHKGRLRHLEEQVSSDA